MIQIKEKSDDLLILLDAVKLYLRVDDDVEDSLITDFIKNAQNFIENYTSRALTINTYNYIPDDLNILDCDDLTDRIRIKKGKITEIISIKIYDSDNTETIFNIDDFTFLNFDQYSYILTKDGSEFPLGDREYSPLIVEFKAGFTKDDIPYDLKEAILKLIANYYEYRESFSAENMTEIPSGLKNIMNKYVIMYF